jgi:hypothetical protein
MTDPHTLPYRPNVGAVLFNPEGLVVGVRHTIEGGSVFQTTFWFVGNTEPE